MDLNKRMNDFRLASRELYNQYFFSHDTEQVLEAEERHSNLLEHLFQYMVLAPECIQGPEYFDVNRDLIVSFKPRSGGFYVIEVEKDRGQWSIEKIPCTLQSPTMFFQYFFDWDELGIKDNMYVKGTLASCPEAEHLIGKDCLFEANSVLYSKA